jgi:ribosomal protein S18 acetylase RimI-like enzyme
MGGGALKGEVRAIADPPGRSARCAALTRLLPDWFGLPESNARYIAGVAECICFGMFDANEHCIGMLALRPHFETTAEVWWMAVHPDHHRRGIGKALLSAAVSEAVARGCTDLVLMTLSDESDDQGYAATRAFYVAQGFRPLVADHMSDGDNPLMWMIQRLDRKTGGKGQDDTDAR